MDPRSPKLIAAIAFAAVAWLAQSYGATAQTSTAQKSTAQTGTAQTAEHPLPQALIFEHAETLERLTILTKRPGEVGIKARAAIETMKAHGAREREFILPPLTLLPSLADGKVTPDMAWAIAMADRVRAEREQIFTERSRITEALSELVVAATRANDKEAAEFAEGAQGDSFNDAELLEPAVLLIGEYLRGKLSPAH